ncbi:MAG: hypothetical protein CMK59_06575 [Proteobacteria bacterium]|nr:hypothetical protein [Pseudomonadota bacterium]
MTFSDALLFGMVAVMAINYVATRWPNWENRPVVFWLAQLANLTAATYLFYEGIPEFQGELAVVNVLIGALFIFHILQNNRRYQRVIQDRRAEYKAQQQEILKQELQRIKEESSEEKEPPSGQ